MSTSDQRRTLDVATAARRIQQSCFPGREGGAGVGAVGLEPEYFVFKSSGERLPLYGEQGVIDLTREVARRSDRVAETEGSDPPEFVLAQGGRFTFEPGGQLEHSTAVHPTSAEALADVEQTLVLLAGTFHSHGVFLASAGTDLWNSVDAVPQQLKAPRYRAMAAYLARRGPEGAVMMRNTTSLQVNLDLGPPEVARERWLLANLASPIATASFASSPGEGCVSRRALAWQGLDPTRTGFPASLLDGSSEDPGEQYADFVLSADVLLFREQGQGAEAGAPGFSFRQWMEQGHERFGFPGPDDLDYHLTTVFPEVRQRGFLEIRSADSLPAMWRPAIVLFWTGLLYDREARELGIELLGATRPRLHELWQVSARAGLRDPELAERALALCNNALDGARRLPAGYHRPLDLERSEEFVARYVKQRRCPSDELREICCEGLGACLVWGREDGVVQA